MTAAARAEAAKLARVLGTVPGRLAFLERADPAAVEALRDQVVDLLFEADGGLERAAAANRLLPTQLLAVIGRKAFGPLLCARLSGLIEPARAVAIAAHMPTDFLAELAAEMDPRRARDVVARIPAGQIVDCAVLMAQAGEFVAMGRFVGHLPEESLRATIAELDDETLLRVAFVLDDRSRLDHLVGMLGDDRLAGIVRVAAGMRLVDEADLLVDSLGPANSRRLAALAGEVDDAELRERWLSRLR